MNITVGYARTSTADQTAGLDDQVAVLTAAGCTRIYSEHASAATTHRAQLQACLSGLQSGDTLTVTKPDRLARSVRDMMTLVDDLRARGVFLRILSMGVDTGNPTGTLILTVLSGVAEWERSIMKERQAVGIAAARAAGKYQGRARALSAQQVDAARTLITTGLTRADAARTLGVGRSTLYRALSHPSTAP